MTTITKRINLIYALLLAVAIPLLTACNDDIINVDEPTKENGKITVRFRAPQVASNTTRAGAEGELMSVWTVIAVEDNDAAKVVGIWSCKPNTETSIDFIDAIVAELDKGKDYKVYSFANMGALKLESYLKLSPGTIPVPTETGKIFSNTGELNNCTLKDVDKIHVPVEGNGFVPTKENKFEATGIPMSNVQTFSNLQDGSIKELVVIRMMAKITLQIYNDMGEGNDVTLESIELTNLTADTGEIMLLPELKDKGGHNTNTNTTEKEHGNILPNLYKGEDGKTPPDQEGYFVYEYDENNKKIVSGTDNKSTGKPLVFDFYVNESDEPKGNYGPPEKDNPNYNPDFYHFFLKINLKKTVVVPGENGETTTEDITEYRYVLIDDNGTESGEKWNYIARNDYRIIPIVLDDYKLDMIPYDFPAIGVYPASVKEEDGIYTINFHDYGHFHLVPQVTKYSDVNTSKKVVPYGKSSTTDTDKTYWTLLKENGVESWANSWGSWTDATKTKEYKNEKPDTYPETFNNIPFYRLPDTNNPLSSQDGDDAGGEPVWYKNDGTDGPKWQPNSTIGYVPFIFGYIADPKPDNGKMGDDKKVYHEFSINLYKNGTGAARQMTYRLYMILDQEQMLYRSRSKTAPVSKCTHHCHERW